MTKSPSRSVSRPSVFWSRSVFLFISLLFSLILLFILRTAVSSAPETVPDPPIINEPAVDGQIVSPSDVHMETDPMHDPDGDAHQCSDFQILISDTLELVWDTVCIGGLEKVHTHLGDGVFVNSYAGRTELEHDVDYLLRIRHIDSNNEVSPWSLRFFHTGPPTQLFPLLLDDILGSPAPQWVDSVSDPVVLPAGSPQPFLRLESAVGGILLEFSGLDGVNNVTFNPPPLLTHENVRIQINAGDTGSNLVLPESDLTFVDHEGNNHTIYLPSVNVTTTQSVYFWVSATGSTYVGNAAQTTPDFSTLARGAPVPWNVLQPGYKVEVVASGFQLPVKIAFVPDGLYPGDPGDPYYYVTELYGQIKVVTHDGTVHDYVTGLLNFNPTGNFPGTGEQGVTGVTVDPATGDVFASMLYSTNPSDDGAPHYPKVMRFHSDDGGISASTTITVLDMVGESQGQSHQISNLSIGPDNKLYVHMGDGFTAATALNLDSFRGKILRMNLDGTAPPDNPFYTGGGGARDYVYAYGVRNPFGGDWREADGELYEVENGPNTDRFARIIAGTSYGWSGNDNDMLINAIYNWNPATAPVDLAFIQDGTFGSSGFPAEKEDHAFVSLSGPTWATGPQSRGKRIEEFVVDGSGNLVSGPTTLVSYNGSGKGTAAGITAGPDGLYFTDLYKDLDYATPIDAGANILRIRFVGVADFEGSPQLGLAPLNVVFTDTSNVPNPTSWLWDFGDGTTSTSQNPTHTYTQTGAYDVRLRVTSDDGISIEQKDGYILVGDFANGTGLLGQYYHFSGGTPPPNPFQTFVLDRNDATIDFDWGTGSPGTGINNDLFSVRWTGQVEPLHSEEYTFYTYSDDGIRLYVDGQLVVDDWSDHGARERSGTISLQAGKKYDLEIHYYENGGDAIAQVSWESANQTKEIIPQSALYPPADLSVTKTASAASVDNGAFLTYTLAVTNNGPYTASAVIVSDTLPSGLTFVSGPNCSEAAGVVNCSLGTIPSGTMSSTHFAVHVPLTATGSIINAAETDADSFDHILSNNSDTEVTAVNSTNPPLIYVASSILACNFNTPCTDSPILALSQVADNGHIVVLDNITVDTGLMSGNSGANNLLIDGPGTLTWDSGVGGTLLTIGTGNVTIDSIAMEAIAPGTAVSLTSSGNVTIQNSINTIASFDVAVAVHGPGTAVVKGSSFDGNNTIFEQSDGTLIAYANNIETYTTAVNATGGSRSLAHNWWGTYSDPAPPGLAAPDWAARLGAPVVSWADGDGAAVLGAAQLTGGGGTAVIVNHGRSNWPFGVGITGSVISMCSDYYDFFTVNGSGTWSLEVPVDDDTDCNLNALMALKLYWITDIADCDGPGSTSCWDLIVTNISAVGQNLVVSGLTVSDLGGTPFVSGASGIPTAITLRTARAIPGTDQTWLLLLLGLTFSGLTVGTVQYKRRSKG
ncbi:MAG: PQQ-dependent sugar dehydrogenase [Candidatus Promineifilaceae bacterium]